MTSPLGAAFGRCCPLLMKASPLDMELIAHYYGLTSSAGPRDLQKQDNPEHSGEERIQLGDASVR